MPKLVLRTVRLTPNETLREVVDGQQRITTVQRFYSNDIRLPKSLKSINPEIPGKTYSQLSTDVRRYIDRQDFHVDVIGNIEDPRNPDHQRLATEIFWRLQQGESLNQMEIAHARLNSLGRNFIVKYADDITFDFDAYQPIDTNPHKHPFFGILDRPNDRMQHLSLLARMILLASNGPTDLKDGAIVDWIDKTTEDNGVGNHAFEDQPVAKETLSILNFIADLFSDDPITQNGGTVKELKPDYVVLSLFLLARHVRIHYVIDNGVKQLLRNFYISFHERYRGDDLSDTLMVEFRENRQHSAAEVRMRELIIRQAFFEYASEKEMALTQKHTKRAFDESQRIAIYRRDRGLCQMCLADGHADSASLVPWAEYEADHILAHSHGGLTDLSNAQLLCKLHNRQKRRVMLWHWLSNPRNSQMTIPCTGLIRRVAVVCFSSPPSQRPDDYRAGQGNPKHKRKC